MRTPRDGNRRARKLATTAAMIGSAPFSIGEREETCVPRTENAERKANQMTREALFRPSPSAKAGLRGGAPWTGSGSDDVRRNVTPLAHGFRPSAMKRNEAPQISPADQKQPVPTPCEAIDPTRKAGAGAAKGSVAAAAQVFGAITV